LLQLTPLAIGACLLALPETALAQYHYPPGVEGIKGGTLPPPGFYIRDYNLFYFADRLNDPHSAGIPADLDLFVYANGFRPIWITKCQILGGNYGMDIFFPFINTEFEIDTPMGRLEDSYFGLGDIFVEPITLSWHWAQWDLGVGYGFWAPTGYVDPMSPAKPGKGFWSNMFTLGGTWYPDKAKTWSVSLLNRYEIHSEEQHSDITPGNMFTLEWGVGKGISKTVEVGVVGYYQQQTTTDCGAGASPDKERVFGVGPEISVFVPQCPMFVSVRYLREFGAMDRPEGNTLTLTVTKPF